MRLPDTIERLYLDFDGFFASVEQLANPSLRGRPVGVVPFAGTDRTSMIACSREAKSFGVKNVMRIAEARALCPDLILVPQKPDIYRRAHNSLLSVIEMVLPVDAVKSIDEMTCRLDDVQRHAPEALAARLRAELQQTMGSFITCSIGMAANRQLAKMACKSGKKNSGGYGNGLAIWHPQMMPGPLFDIPLQDVPGVGGNMYRKLMKLGIIDTPMLYRTQPKQMRRIWGNVTGERLWYALHGYDIQAPETGRGAFGHGRVLPPESRTLAKAYDIARLLMIKAGRRLRREGYYCSGVCLWLSIRDDSWSRRISVPVVNDDQAILAALEKLWRMAGRELANPTIFRVGVTLVELSLSSERQLDMLSNDDQTRRKWESANSAIDVLNKKYAGTVVSLGPWAPPSGGHVGGKISYTRIPSADDFW